MMFSVSLLDAFMLFDKIDTVQLIYCCQFWSIVYSLWLYNAAFYVKGWKYLMANGIHMTI